MYRYCYESKFHLKVGFCARLLIYINNVYELYTF